MKFSSSCTIILILGAMVLLSARAISEIPSNLSRKPIQALSEQLNGDHFNFEIWPLGMDPTKFNISIVSTSENKDGLISISNEAKILSRFLNLISKNGINIRHVSYITMHGINEKEIQSRLMDAAGQSLAWLHHSKGAGSDVVDQLLQQATAYQEIDTVLKQVGLRIENIGTEKILVKRSASGKNMLPYSATVFLRLVPIDLKK